MRPNLKLCQCGERCHFLLCDFHDKPTLWAPECHWELALHHLIVLVPNYIPPSPYPVHRTHSPSNTWHKPVGTQPTHAPTKFNPYAHVSWCLISNPTSPESDPKFTKCLCSSCRDILFVQQKFQWLGLWWIFNHILDEFSNLKSIRICIAATWTTISQLGPPTQNMYRHFWVLDLKIWTAPESDTNLETMPLQQPKRHSICAIKFQGFGLWWILHNHILEEFSNQSDFALQQPKLQSLHRPTNTEYAQTFLGTIDFKFQQH